jgi:hypothetical protein
MGLDEYKRPFEEFVCSWAAGFAWLNERPPAVSSASVEVPSSDSEFYRMLAACHREDFGNAAPQVHGRVGRYGAAGMSEPDLLWTGMDQVLAAAITVITSISNWRTWHRC